MGAMRDDERRYLQRHEEWISRPVRELFPKDARLARQVRCLHCKTIFTWVPTTARYRMFCTGDCKNEFYRKKKGALPAMPAEPPGAVLETTD